MELFERALRRYYNSDCFRMVPVRKHKYCPRLPLKCCIVGRLYICILTLFRGLFVFWSFGLFRPKGIRPRPLPY